MRLPWNTEEEKKRFFHKSFSIAIYSKPIILRSNRMTKFEDLSLTKKIGIVSLLLLAIFIIAGAIGYFAILLEDNGSTTRATSWAIKAKIGFIWLSLPIIGFVISKIGFFLRNLLNLNLPFFLSQAIFMGCAFAIFDGANIVLLGIESGEFRSKVLDGFVMGSISGGIAGILIQKTEKVEKVDNLTSQDT